MNKKFATFFIVGISSAVFCAIGIGLLLIDPPAQMRLQQLDKRRTEDLEAISRTIDNYYQTRGSLPAKLETLKQVNGYLRLEDFESGQSYEYRIAGSSSYQLCAVFNTASKAPPNDPLKSSPFWNHDPGRHCFDIDVFMRPK